jgi:hypothetical protein
VYDAGVKRNRSTLGLHFALFALTYLCWRLSKHLKIRTEHQEAAQVIFIVGFFVIVLAIAAVVYRLWK